MTATRKLTGPHGCRSLACAMAYRSRMGGTAPGAAQAALRRAILGSIGPLGTPTPEAIGAELRRLCAIGIPDMPVDADDLSLLIDTICMRRGYTSRADAWRHIGISPNTGRSLLGQNAQAINWPIWKTARDAAIGE